jgi:hypothetical protein
MTPGITPKTQRFPFNSVHMSDNQIGPEGITIERVAFHRSFSLVDLYNAYRHYINAQRRSPGQSE